MEEINYQKIIQTGQEIEIYEYEQSPRPRRRNKKKRRRFYNRETRRNDNVYRQKRTFKRLVKANLGGLETPILATFTYRGIATLQQGYKDYNLFIKRLRYIFGKDFRYITAPEFQKRGSVHFHSLIWGLPKKITDSERQTRRISSLWRHGFIDIRPTDGHTKLATYLSKYMTKALLDKRLGGKKAYTTSRNIKRPVTHKNSTIYNYLEELFGINLSTDDPIQEKIYNTEWLGKGHYRLYKIKNDNN